MDGKGMNRSARVRCTGLLVKFAKTSASQTRMKLRKAFGAGTRVETLSQAVDWSKFVSAAVPPEPGAAFDFAAQIRTHPGVLDAEPALS